MKVGNWLMPERLRGYHSCLRHLVQRRGDPGFGSVEAVVAADRGQVQDAFRTRIKVVSVIRRGGRRVAVGCLGSCLERRVDWSWGLRGGH